MSTKKPKYKDKICLKCEVVFSPTSPKQKFCLKCSDIAKKEAQSLRDKKRNRLKHNVVHTRVCKICGVTFETYDIKKFYCGSVFCEQSRKFNNSISIEEKRQAKFKKARHIADIKRKAATLKYIKAYIEARKYKLISAKKYKTTHHSALVLECPEGHLWKTSFHGFRDSSTYQGNRCPTCYLKNLRVSRPEQKVRDFIEQEFPNLEVVYNDRTILSPKELDLYFPQQKLAIEVCGLYWHSDSNGKPRNYHYKKMEDCFNKGIRLMTIFEDELVYNFEIIKSRIRQALFLTKRKIYARQCQVVEVDYKTATEFLKENHIQGPSRKVLVSYGLLYNNELVCLGMLGELNRPQFSVPNSLEFKRFCTALDVSVVGGVSKIFKHIVKYSKESGYDNVLSYCDMRYVNTLKPVQEVLGFKLKSVVKYSPHYFKNYYRQLGVSDQEYDQQESYYRLWDCGHRTYVYSIN